MMGPLLNEVQAMQNPALGAGLIWRFACGYCPENQGREGAPLPLAFVVLPVVLHMRTWEGVASTQMASGARKFEEKFKESVDLLHALNDRAATLRQLSLRSLRVAMACGLVTVLSEKAEFWPRSYTRPCNTSSAVVGLMNAAEKLGAWCAPLSLYEISGILRVEF